VGRVETRCSPTAIKTPEAVKRKGSMSAMRVEEIVDAPFLANDVFEGSYKANRRLAMHQLHPGLDL
jgi:hypothetical protein